MFYRRGQLLIPMQGVRRFESGVVLEIISFRHGMSPVQGVTETNGCPVAVFLVTQVVKNSMHCSSLAIAHHA